MNYLELATSNIGKQCDIKGTVHTVTKLLEKTGKMKNGTEASYVLLTADSGAEVELHPRRAQTLFSKGEEAGIRMLVEAVIEDEASATADPAPGAAAEEHLPEEIHAPVEAIIVAEEAATVTDPLPTEIVCFPAKMKVKTRCIEAYKAGVTAGETRQQILARFVTCGCTSKPGQATYYQNIKNKKAGWE